MREWLNECTLFGPPPRSKHPAGVRPRPAAAHIPAAAALAGHTEMEMALPAGLVKTDVWNLMEDGRRGPGAARAACMAREPVRPDEQSCRRRSGGTPGRDSRALVRSRAKRATPKPAQQSRANTLTSAFSQRRHPATECSLAVTASYKIDSADLTIDDLFKDFYMVPDFQREYVWGAENVERLLQDAYHEFSDDEGAIVAEGSEYFIGSLVVCPEPNGTYQLIDGQQRMTTSYLITYFHITRRTPRAYFGKMRSISGL